MIFLGEIRDDIKMIVEETEGGKEKNYYLQGVFTESDKLNKNKRIYPHRVLQKEMNRYIKEAVEKKSAVGELGHPENININLDKVSHRIVELKEDGNQFIGKAKVMNTPMGKICQEFVREGAQLGISSRAAGSVEQSHHGDVVGDDLHVVAFDVVHDPSCAAAMLEGIMESKEFYFANGILQEKQYDKIQKQVKKLTKVEMDEGALLRIFEEILRQI